MDLNGLLEAFGELDRRKISALILASYLVSGFMFAALINFSGLGVRQCTLASCNCEEVKINRTTMEATASPITGEVDCNDCEGARFLYHNGVFWISQEKQSTQVAVCEEGEKTREYYRTDSLGEIQAGNIFTGKIDFWYIGEIFSQFSQGILNP